MNFHFIKKEIQVTLFVALFTFGLYFFYLAQFDFNIGALMGVSNYLQSQLSSLPESIPTFPGQGHDGGYIWAMAKNPFLPNLKETSFHYERWFYPFAAWVLSLGQIENLTWSMPLINFMSTILIAYFSALFFNLLNFSPWWGVLVALGPGAAMPLRFNLVDQYALLWALLSFYSYQKNKYVYFSFFASLAFLTRPTSIGIIIVGFLALLSKLKKDRHLALMPILGLLPFFALKFYWINFKGLPISYFPDGEGNFSLPFIALTKQLLPQLKESGAIKTLIFGFTVTFYFSILLWAFKLFIDRFKKNKDLDFESMVICGFCLASLSMGPIMLLGGTMQVARFTPIFPLVIKNSLDDIKSSQKSKKYFAFCILMQTILASLMGVIWILTSKIKL